MFRIFLTIGSLQVLAIVLNFVKSKTIAVMLGPEGVGVISVIDQVVQSTSYFCALSLPFASIKFLSRSHSESEDAFKRSYSSFLKGLLILSALKFTIVVMFYMHLKYDHRLFRVLFTGPLLIASLTLLALMFLFGHLYIKVM